MTKTHTHTQCAGERVSISWLNSLPTARAGPDWRKETKNSLHIFHVGGRHVNIWAIADSFHGCISRKLDWKQSGQTPTGTLTWGVHVTSGSLTSYVTDLLQGLLPSYGSNGISRCWTAQRSWTMKQAENPSCRGWLYHPSSNNTGNVHRVFQIKSWDAQRKKS